MLTHLLHTRKIGFVPQLFGVITRYAQAPPTTPCKTLQPLPPPLPTRSNWDELGKHLGYFRHDLELSLNCFGLQSLLDCCCIMLEGFRRMMGKFPKPRTFTDYMLIGLFCIGCLGVLAIFFKSFSVQTQSSHTTPTPVPKQQHIVRVWKGDPTNHGYRAKEACGIPWNSNGVKSFQSQGWRIVSSTPISYRINQGGYYYDCNISEVLMEK